MMAQEAQSKPRKHIVEEHNGKHREVDLATAPSPKMEAVALRPCAVRCTKEKIYESKGEGAAAPAAQQ